MLMHVAGFFRLTKLTFIKKQHEGGDIFTFFFTPTRPLKHIAGQHGVFFLPGLRGVHIFSLSSAPDEQYVTFSTHVRKGSTYKQRLDALQPGDVLRFLGPVLDFTLKEDTSNYVFLAQGIGITPFRSMLVHAQSSALPIATTLIHVESAAHTFQEETQSLATHAYYPSNPEEFTQKVKETLNTNASYYLSGAPKFVRATKRTLRTLGVNMSRIRSDTFLGY
jgi:ferredoxin-NADP reductase